MLQLKISLNARLGKVPSCGSTANYQLTNISQTNLNASIDFQPAGMITAHGQRLNFMLCYIKVSKSTKVAVGLGWAAGFIISICFPSAHRAMTQFTRMISSISLCLLFVFSPTLGCDFFCFRLYTQSKDQSNVLKEFILPNFWLCERFSFTCSEKTCLEDRT